jgi:His/Glu/Gln/Arg/opine family amino acid ABC transporter permease subunit
MEGGATSATAASPPPADRAQPDRGLRWFLREQTVLSSAVGILGTVALALLFVGTFAVLTSHGWTPSERLASGITSPGQGLVLFLSIGIGLVATVAGTASYRRMPTKPSRETAISGAVLGLQAIGLSALFLWFRAGDVELFARNFFEFQLIEEHIGRFFRAALNTIILAFSGEALGILIGLVMSVLVLSDHRVVRAPARTYINFFRGTPLLWQLSFFFFGIALGLRVNIGAYEVAIIVLGLNAGAYCAEIFRAGIQSIERGQFEAARSLGLSYFMALRLVILPQAIRRVIPPLTNEFVILIKDTSLVAVLGLSFHQQELLATGRDIFSQTFNATPFLISAAGYLAVTLPLIRAVTWLEHRLRSGLTGIGP